MKDDLEKSLQARPEQIVYADILEKGMLLGLFVVLVTYVIYILGVMKPYVPMEAVTKYWETGVQEYLHQCRIKPGWAWLTLIGYGDFLNFVGIALLAGVTIICFLAITPVLWRGNDKVYAAFALLEAIILGVAASGVLGAGGH